MKLLRHLRSLFRKEELDAEMAEEMRAHLELQAAEYEKRGMSAVDARYAAQREFGGVEQIKERARDQRGWLWLDQTRQDLRYGVRMLGKRPGFTAGAAAILALGIGANAAVFNLVHTLLFTPPAYARPAEIFRVFSQDRKNPAALRDFSYPAYLEIRDRRRRRAPARPLVFRHPPRFPRPAGLHRSRVVGRTAAPAVRRHVCAVRARHARLCARARAQAHRSQRD